MSKTEDYLDNLLNAVEHGDTFEDTQEIETPEAEIEGIGRDKKKRNADDEFFDDFERELIGGIDEDDFLRDFERELAEEEAALNSGSSEHADPFFDNLDGIVNSVKASMEEKNNASDEDDGVELDPELMDLLKAEGELQEYNDDAGQDDNADGLFDEMGLEVEFVDAGIPMDAVGDTDISEDAIEEEKPKDKMSFLEKVSHTLFGEDEEEGEEKTAADKKVSEIPANMDDLSDENLQILQELDGSSAVIPEKEVEQESPEDKKKREKAEKKEKKKQEQKEKKAQKDKEKQEKKAKKAKEPKKPKAPKERDNTPPLPKKPVILIFIMTASFVVLVLLGTNLFGYSNSMAAANRNYDMGNYEQALQEVSGMEIKEEDYDTYQKFWLMANASSQYSAYQSFMESGLYDMALDCLIRTIGKCEKYRPDAELYSCVDALDKVENRAIDALSGFGISKERALEVYGYEDRQTYSAEIYNILTEAGLGVIE